jgi:hypothetical protein
MSGLSPRPGSTRTLRRSHLGRSDGSQTLGEGRSQFFPCHRPAQDAQAVQRELSVGARQLAPVLERNSARGGGDHGFRNRTERPGPTCERHEYRSGFILGAAPCELLRLDMRGDERPRIRFYLRPLSLYKMLAKRLELLESERH